MSQQVDHWDMAVRRMHGGSGSSGSSDTTLDMAAAMRARAGHGQVQWHVLTGPLRTDITEHPRHARLEQGLHEWCHAHRRAPADVGCLPADLLPTPSWWDDILLQSGWIRLDEAEQLLGQALDCRKRKAWGRAISCAKKAGDIAGELLHVGPQAVKIRALAEQTEQTVQKEIPLSERSEEEKERDRAAKAASHQRKHGVLGAPGRVHAAAPGAALVNKYSSAGDYWRCFAQVIQPQQPVLLF